jgi:hypothetical protein
MKTTMIFKTGITLLLLIGISFNTDANTTPYSSTPTSLKESSDATMKVKVPSNMNTFVSILDQSGTMIFSDVVSKDASNGKSYDFSKIKNGVYTFKAESDQKLVEKTLVVDKNELRIVKKEKKYLPVFSIDGDFLMVNYLNSNEENISLSLEDQIKSYYKETGERDMAYGKIINIKSLDRGNYVFTFTAGEDTYNYTFRR